jgi:hypothetical protein
VDKLSVRLKSPIKGLRILNLNWGDSKWVLYGKPNPNNFGLKGTKAREFEEFLKVNISCDNITFDSDYSEFFAYAETRERIESFCDDAIKKLKNNL